MAFKLKMHIRSRGERTIPKKKLSVVSVVLVVGMDSH